MGVLYWVMYDVLKVALWTFYKDIRVVGDEHVPRRRPVLICGNHGNMVMDPLIIGLTMPHKRECHFWAMKELFHGNFGKLLRSLGAVPVDRKNKDNKLLFKETIETLQAGGAMALFPEGTSYTEPHILQLKDGASRAALEFAQEAIFAHRRTRNRDGAALSEADLAAPPTAEELHQIDFFHMACIVPVGINYAAKDTWRSDVVVEYGPAIEVEEYVTEYFVNPKAAVKRLTEHLYGAIRLLTVNAEDWTTLRLLQLARTIYMSSAPEEERATPEQLVWHAQGFARAYEQMSDDPHVKTLRRDVERYQADLDALRVSDSQVHRLSRGPGSTFSVTVDLLRAAWTLLKALPLLLPGIVLHFPILVLAKIVASREVYPEAIAQKLLGVMLVTVPAVYLTTILAAWWLLALTKRNLLALVVTLGLFGWSHLIAVDQGLDSTSKLKDAYRFLVIKSSAAGRAKLDELSDRRASISRRLNQVVERYRHLGLRTPAGSRPPVLVKTSPSAGTTAMAAAPTTADAAAAAETKAAT